MGFKEVAISDIGLTITGKTPSSVFPSDFGETYMFITPSDNFDSKYITKTARFLSEDGYKKLKLKSLPQNSILVSCIGSAMGKVSMNRSTAISNQQINSLIPNSKYFDNDYVYYCFKNNYSLFRNAASGSTALPLLNKSDFDKLRLRIHDEKDTQRIIGSVLSALDDKIELNNKVNSELEQMAKTLYNYWFVQFDFPNEEGRPYKSSGGKMVYDKVLKRELPEEWEVNKLNTLTSFLSRGISPKYIEGEHGIPVLNQKCIREHRVLFEFQRRHDNEAKNASSRFIKKYDVLVNSTGVGTLGRVALVRWLNEEEVTVDSHVTIIRALTEKINTVFFGYSLLSKQAEIESFANGSTGQVELNRNQLSDINLIVPPRNLQDRFCEYYQSIIEKTSINERQNCELVQLRDWLLPMLMNGQVKVSDNCNSDNDERSIVITKEMDLAAEPTIEYQKLERFVNNESLEIDPRFESWLAHQGLAARGDIDTTTLREIFDAMDDDDK